MKEHEIIQYLILASFCYHFEMMCINKGKKYHGKVSYCWNKDEGYIMKVYYVRLSDRYK